MSERGAKGHVYGSYRDAISGHFIDTAGYVHDHP